MKIRNVSSGTVSMSDLSGSQGGSGLTLGPGAETTIFNEDAEKSNQLGSLITAGVILVVNSDEPSHGQPQAAANPVIVGPIPNVTVVTQPSAGQVLIADDATHAHWAATGGTVLDASDTVKGVTKLSVAPAVPTNPIAVGANDPALGNAVSIIGIPVQTSPAPANGGVLKYISGPNKWVASTGLISSIHADANPALTGAVQLVSGTNVTLSQVGQAITINATGGGNATSLQSRTLAATAPTDGQVIAWNGTANQWEPTTGGGGGGNATSIQSVAVSATPPTGGQILQYDVMATAWVPVDLRAKTLLDSSGMNPIALAWMSAPTSGQVLTADGAGGATFATPGGGVTYPLIAPSNGAQNFTFDNGMGASNGAGISYDGMFGFNINNTAGSPINIQTGGAIPGAIIIGCQGGFKIRNSGVTPVAGQVLTCSNADGTCYWADAGGGVIWPLSAPNGQNQYGFANGGGLSSYNDGKSGVFVILNSNAGEVLNFNESLGTLTLNNPYASQYSVAYLGNLCGKFVNVNDGKSGTGFSIQNASSQDVISYVALADKVTIGKALAYTVGTLTLGYVLTTDASGNASWAAPAGASFPLLAPSGISPIKYSFSAASDAGLAYDDFGPGITLTAGASHDLLLKTGDASYASVVRVTAGNSSVGDGGAVYVTSGNCTGSGAGGNISLNPGTGTPNGKVVINGTIKIVDSTQGAGKVLTSDAAGVGSWQAPVEQVFKIRLGAGSTIAAKVAAAPVGGIPAGWAIVDSTQGGVDAQLSGGADDIVFIHSTGKVATAVSTQYLDATFGGYLDIGSLAAGVLKTESNTSNQSRVQNWNVSVGNNASITVLKLASW